MIDQFQKLLVMFIYGVSSIKFHFIDVFQNFNIVIATITECLKKKKKKYSQWSRKLEKVFYW